MIYRPPDDPGRNAQPAEPHRIATGPILSESPWAGRLPAPQAHVAIVVVYHKGDHEVMWPNARRRVSLARRPTTVYEVDLSLHQAAVAADVPSRTDACAFHADITVQWRVTDPSATVRHRVADAAETLAPHLLHRIRGITRNYDITHASAAEDDVNKQFDRAAVSVGAPGQSGEPESTDSLGAEYGLWARSITHLTLDEAAAEHKAKMAKLTWAIEEENAEQELRLLQEDHKRRITADRMEVYRQIIATGDTERFALQLADHPDDIGTIEKIIREEQRVSRRDTIDFVARMVDSGVIERWQVNDEIKVALAWLREATARVIPDKRDNPEGGQGERRRGRAPMIQEDTDPELEQMPESRTSDDDSNAPD